MKTREQTRGEVIIYRSGEDRPKIEVRLRDDNIWLSQKEIAGVFGTDRTVITRHINNILNSGEVEEKGNVQKMHIANSDRPVNFYSLDVIISVGYRVNSKKATQFRIWANGVLRDFLIKGYVVNQQRLVEQSETLKELQDAIRLIQSKAKFELLDGQEKELLAIISEYAKSLTFLYEYDEDKLKVGKGKKEAFALDYEKCWSVVSKLKLELCGKREAGELFGSEYPDKFVGILGNLYQSFGGEDLYKSVEEKAAHLLYFVIKDHPFYDGNKRIASMLFVYYLNQNGIVNIDQRALVSLALLVAVSGPSEKETMVKIVANLIK
ncbi:MAG: RhuM family protein [Patescibacteria group bacterium]|jgi:prophage maintenance system killer protein